MDRKIVLSTPSLGITYLQTPSPAYLPFNLSTPSLGITGL